MARILIVDDEFSIRQVLNMHLSLVGHSCFEAEDAAAARKVLEEESLDLALLDIMLPGEDGFSLAKDFLRKEIPILFLTAKTGVADRVKGLQMGAWDYVLKPFEPAELLARVENILKRTRKEDTKFICGDLTVDFEARTVFRNGKEISLTVIEFDLLTALIRRRNVAMSRQELLRLVWGYDYMGETRTVDVHIQRLRDKIGTAMIETVYKYGYRFRPQEESK